MHFEPIRELVDDGEGADTTNVRLFGFNEGFNGFDTHLAEAQYSGVHGAVLLKQCIEGRGGQRQHGNGGAGETELLAIERLAAMMCSKNPEL